jgi:hypothetical protein
MQLTILLGMQHTNAVVRSRHNQDMGDLDRGSPGSAGVVQVVPW